MVAALLVAASAAYNYKEEQDVVVLGCKGGFANSFSSQLATA